MNSYRFTYTIDGLRLTEKELINADSDEEAIQLLIQRRGHNLKNIEFEITNIDKEGGENMAKSPEKKVAYTKPVIIAQNNSTGCYAAGCPANRQYISETECRRCFRLK